MRNFLKALMLAVLTAYCSGNEATQGAPLAPGVQQPVTVTRLASGSEPLTQNSGISESTRLVVRDAAVWADTWARIRPERPAPALPAVDFSREMLIVAGLGTRPSGGHSIIVESASREGESLQVVIRTETPVGCVGIAALTAPVDVARVPRTDGDVRFTERSVTRNC